MYGRACGSVDPGGGSGEAGAGGVSGRYPEVSLSREELLRLAPEMVGENPKTLTEAYRSWQEAEKDREMQSFGLSWRLRPRIRKIRRPLPAPSPTPARPRPPGPMTNFYLPIRDKNGTA